MLLHSPSGAGKSSLIQAGLVPRLAERFDVWGPARVHLPPPDGNPAAVNRYVRSANLSFEGQIPEARQRPADDVSRMTLSAYAAGRPRRRTAPENVVLLFDQFEEVLTAAPLAFDAKREFFLQLAALLQDPKVWALFALREDYLAQFDPYADLLPTHLKNRFRLDLLTRDAARESIVQTAAQGGRDAAPNAVDKLVRDLATMQVQRPDGSFESQTGPYVEPLHLQVACRGLWERIPADKRTIDLDDIASFGDVIQALAGYYEREVGAIAGGGEHAEREIREWVGERLITPEGIRGQVLKGAGKSEGLANETIERLVDMHLVRGESRAGAVWYELAHDRLIEPVRSNNAAWRDAHLNQVQKVAALWETQGRPPGSLITGPALVEAQQWASRQAGVTPAERRFLAASEEAHAAAEKERRQQRRLRWLVAISITVGVLALVAFGIALDKSRLARAETVRAEESLRKAQTASEDAANSARQVRWAAWRSEGAQLRELSIRQKRIQEAQEDAMQSKAVRIVSESDATPGLTAAEYDNLWQLVGAAEHMRELVLEQYLPSAPNAKKFFVRREYLLQALLGFDPQRRIGAVRAAVDRSCTTAAMWESPEIRTACLSLVNEMPSTSTDLLRRFLPLLRGMTADELEWLRNGLSVVIDKRAVGHRIVADGMVPLIGASMLPAPWQSLLDALDGFGPAVSAADIRMAGHAVSQALLQAKLPANPFQSLKDWEAMGKAFAPLTNFLARQQAQMAREDLTAAAPPLLKLMDRDVNRYLAIDASAQLITPLTRFILNIRSCLPPADVVQAGKATAGQLAIQGSRSVLLAPDPLLASMSNLTLEYRPFLKAEDFSDAVKTFVSSISKQIQDFIRKEPWGEQVEEGQLYELRMLSDSAAGLGVRVGEMQDLANRFGAKLLASPPRELRVKSLLALGPYGEPFPQPAVNRILERMEVRPLRSE